MAVNKNFVVKNGFEVSSDLLVANAVSQKVGVGTLGPKYKLEVAGGIGATTLNITGLGTIAAFRSGVGIVTNITGTNLSYSGIGTINALRTFTGIITNLNGTNLNYTGICTIGSVSVTSSSGTNLNISGISTLGGVKIEAGIITSTNPGVSTVFYYGDGSNLKNIPPGNTPLGPEGAVQYNENGDFQGSANFIFNGNDVYLAGVITATSFRGNATSATTATNANNINISSATPTDATSSVVLVGSQSTGNQSPFIDDVLLYNSLTNTLTATNFSGSLLGNATTATTATNADNINISAVASSDTTTSIVLVGNQSIGYQQSFIDSGLTYNASTNNLSATTFTGSLVGNVTGNSDTSTTSTNANNINISASSSTDTTTSLVLVASQGTGNQSPFIDGGLLYDALNNTLTTTTFNGNLSGNATTATSAGTAGGLTGSPNITVGTINCGIVESTGSITATDFIDDGVNLLNAINSKPSTGKAIAMSMVFG